MRPSVCIVSTEFIGPAKSGGIGTAMTGLAIALADAGFPVTMLFTDGITVTARKFADTRRHYAKLGITFETIRPRDLRHDAGPIAESGFALPAAVYRWLMARHFDIVHFNDTGGHGHLCLAAKRLGLAFSKTHFAVAVHSPHRWIHSLNETVPETMMSLCFEQAERASIALANTLWLPSRYLKQWLETDGFRFPAETVVQQYVMPPAQSSDSKTVNKQTKEERKDNKVREIVFFGRLEERKGLRIFCDVIERLDSELVKDSIAVSFVGRSVQIGGMASTSWIEQRTRGWQTRSNVITDFDQPAAVAFLKGSGRLAVIASPADNSPCTIYESTNFGIPFLAAATGGIPELVHEADHPRVLFNYNVDALTNKLRAALTAPIERVRPAISDAENRDRWIALHESWMQRLSDEALVSSATPSDIEETAQPTDRPSLAILIRAEDNDVQALESTLSSLSTIRDEIVRCLVVSSSPMLAPESLVALGGKVANGPAVANLLREFVNVGDGFPVLVLEAGTKIGVASLRRHIDGLATSGFDGVIPAATGLNNSTVNALGNGVMLAFHHGLLSTGGVLLSANAMRRVSGEDFTSSAPILELLDKTVIAGTELLASPEVMLERSKLVSRPAIMPWRIALYTKSAGPKALEALLSVAAVAERDGGLVGLLRRLGTRVVASRVGFLTPALARFWRARMKFVRQR